MTTEGILPEPKMMPADSVLWNRIDGLPVWSPSISVPRPDGTNNKPNLRLGVIASGEKVVAEKIAREEIAAGHRKIYALEMEGYGFSRAVWQSFVPVRHLVMRGICDDATKAKNSLWHQYAAASVADLVKHFLMDQPITPHS